MGSVHGSVVSMCKWFGMYYFTGQYVMTLISEVGNLYYVSY